MPSYQRQVEIPGRTAQELYDRASQDIEKFLSKVSIGTFDVERDPSRKEVHIRGSIFSATLVCQESRMELRAQLSLLAMPFRGQLDDGINRWLSKTFDLTNIT